MLLSYKNLGTCVRLLHLCLVQRNRGGRERGCGKSEEKETFSLVWMGGIKEERKEMEGFCFPPYPLLTFLPNRKKWRVNEIESLNFDF